MYERPFLNILTDDEIRTIHYAALEVLSKTGVKIFAPDGVALLNDMGCKVEENRVFIPSYLVEESIQKAPKRFQLYDREGNHAFEVGGKESHFGTGPTTPNVLDILSNERRPTRIKDIEDAARVCDALNNIEWIMPLGSAQDVPAEVADIYEFEAAVQNTSKPIAFIGSDGKGVRDVILMAAAARGDMKSLIQKPFIIAFPEPISPLLHPREAVEEIFAATEAGIPFFYQPAPMMGATSPITLAGALVLGLADALTGLVIAQLKRPGTPVGLALAPCVMDMFTGVLCSGPPEFHLGIAAYTQILHYYDLPSWGAVVTDSKMVDEQAAIESTFSCIMNAFAGVNLVHDVGYLESGMIGSIDMVVLTDEVINMVRRILKGIHINQDTLAVQIIDAVGPGGNFLADEHTLRYCRSETTIMQLMDRQNYDQWKERGSSTLGMRVNSRAKEILKNHNPPQLSREKLKNISEVMRKSLIERRKR